MNRLALDSLIAAREQILGAGSRGIGAAMSVTSRQQVFG